MEIERSGLDTSQIVDPRFSKQPGRKVASVRRLQIRLGHSPDPDDAFMFWGLAVGGVDPRGFEFEHVLKDIQTLNEWALEARLEDRKSTRLNSSHVRISYAVFCLK